MRRKKKLIDEAYQTKLANAIKLGIDKYFTVNVQNQVPHQNQMQPNQINKNFTHKNQKWHLEIIKAFSPYFLEDTVFYYIHFKTKNHF